MPSNEEIAHQRNLLDINRRNLRHYLMQRTRMGDLTPPMVAGGIEDTRREIRHIKDILRGWNVAVENQADDEEPVKGKDLAQSESERAASITAQPSATSTVNNFYAPVNTGPAAFGGPQHNERTQTMGDTFNIRDISGSNVNIKSTLTNVNQTIGNMPGDQASKDELKRLFDQLQVELEKAPTESKDAAEDVAKRANTAAEEAAKPKPDKKDMQYSLERLKEAAENIGKLMPTVLPIAGAIAKQITSMIAG